VYFWNVQATFKYDNDKGLHMAFTCGETIDVLWKSALVGVVGFMAYKWAVKEGVISGNWAARGSKYVASGIRSRVRQ
jgi:hypothetical protein